MATAFQDDAFQADVLAFQIGEGTEAEEEAGEALGRVLYWGDLVANLQALAPPPPRPRNDDEDWLLL
jgi:hypothetical protein